eukprot:TRINITY_DN3550_c0_g1_i2.p2 TRINITY_DN3550_c0_g1~~TRINITY_DN3550_c0_g1_i2.p2  ORF type:complete len:123 (+),score=13.21 TRINITY_DN3550_c0_g1_i2:367-735(+)
MCMPPTMCRAHMEIYSSQNISPATGKAMLPYKGPRGQVFRFTTKAQNFMLKIFNDVKTTPDRNECQWIASQIELNYSPNGATGKASWQQVRTWFKNRRFAEKNKDSTKNRRRRTEAEESPSK